MISAFGAGRAVPYYKRIIVTFKAEFKIFKNRIVPWSGYGLANQKKTPI